MSALERDGFVVVPGPLADLRDISKAYDRAFRHAVAADAKEGSTSVRLNDFVNRDRCFDPIYVHPPLLAAAEEVVGDRFKLSAFHARTVRAKAAAQPLHQDLPALATGFPLLGFIFMIDPFRE